MKNQIEVVVIGSTTFNRVCALDGDAVEKSNGSDLAFAGSGLRRQHLTGT